MLLVKNSGTIISCRHRQLPAAICLAIYLVHYNWPGGPYSSTELYYPFFFLPVGFCPDPGCGSTSIAPSPSWARSENWFCNLMGSSPFCALVDCKFLFLFTADLLVLLLLLAAVRFGFLLRGGDPVGFGFAVFDGDNVGLGFDNVDDCAAGASGCSTVPPTAPIIGSPTESVCE